MLKQNQFGLGNFKLIESSEQGMLAEVERAYRAHAPIVFLAWDPHPMNMRFDLRYLAGGDAVFGPNFGEAAVYTNTRAGYLQECPNIARLLRNLTFTTQQESRVMADMLDRHEPPQVAAANFLKANPQTVAAWLQGVDTFDGRPALEAVRTTSKLAGSLSLERWLADHKIPVGDTVAVLIEYVKTHGRVLFNGVSTVIRAQRRRAHGAPARHPLPAPGARRRRARLAPAPLLGARGVRGGGAALHHEPGLLGADPRDALAGHRRGGGLDPHRRAARHRRRAPPAPVRRAATGARSHADAADVRVSDPDAGAVRPGRRAGPDLDGHLRAAGTDPPHAARHQLGAEGAARGRGRPSARRQSQLLWKVELPSAAPTILAGITQCIMLSLSMVVIAALVGAGGLGVPVVRALNTVQVGMGFEAGFVIVLLAIMLDRISRPAEQSSQ